MLTALLFLVLGCQRSGDLPDARITSPSSGAVVRDLLIPLDARVPDAWKKRTVTATLDGQDITDPLAILRARWSRGGGTDYLSTLSLDGLEPGAHSLRLDFTASDGERDQIESRFRYEPAPCLVRVHLRDAQGSPTTGRVLVYDPQGQPVNLWGADADDADPSDRDDVVPVAFALDGEARLRLPAGTYQLIAVRGLRDGIDVRTVVLDGDLELDMVVPLQVPTPGWRTADLHVHTGRSSDAFVSDRFRLSALASADLDMAVITDHNIVSDAVPAIELLGMQDQVHLISGMEARVGRPGGGRKKTGRYDRNSIAHMNAFPLVRGKPYPPKEPENLEVLLQDWRARQADKPYPGVGSSMVLQLNHPRGIQFFPNSKLKPFHALFSSLDLRPWRPLDEQRSAWLRMPPAADGTGPLDFDALEILNRFSLMGWRQVRDDWFGLMEQGHFLTGTGNSDSHSVHVELVGIPVNLVQDPDGSVAGFVDAIDGGRVRVTTGPVVSLQVTGDGAPAGPGGMVSGSRVTVKVSVDAADWVPVEQVRLVVDGRVVQVQAVQAAEGAVHRGDWTWQVEVADDAWILAEAGWPLARGYSASRLGIFARVAPGYVPIGFTNPVRVDRDGDGVWARRWPKVQGVTGESEDPAPPGSP